MTQDPNLAALSAARLSAWVDLSRPSAFGQTATALDTRNVVGATTIPTIFQECTSHGHAQDADIAALAEHGAEADTAHHHHRRCPGRLRCAAPNPPHFAWRTRQFTPCADRAPRPSCWRPPPSTATASNSLPDGCCRPRLGPGDDHATASAAHH